MNMSDFGFTIVCIYVDNLYVDGSLKELTKIATNLKIEF